MENLDSILGSLGVVIASILVVAAASESVLETFRGVLSSVGFTWLKSAVSLDDAIKEAQDMAKDNGAVLAKLAAVRKVAEGYSSFSKDKLDKFATLDAKLKAAAGPEFVAEVADVLQVNDWAAALKQRIEASEITRVVVLKVLVTAIAFAICHAANLDAVAMLQAAFQTVPDNSAALADAAQKHHVVYRVEIFGQIVTAVAAASGSAYWHDQLDRLRNLKDAASAMK